MSRGPDKRPRPKPDEVRCTECGEAMLKAAAVVMNGEPLHPVGCFEPALRKWRARVDELITKNVGGFELSISMESARPGATESLERLAGDVVRARRAAR